MTQVEKSAPGTLLTGLVASRFGRHALMYLAVIVLIVAVALIGFTVTRQGAPSVQAAPRADEVVDGWMAGIAAANLAATLNDARQVRDGWSSSLLRPEPEAIDGWSTYLLKPEPQVVDGWASGYLVDDD
jgi:hypothetical protein